MRNDVARNSAIVPTTNAAASAAGLLEQVLNAFQMLTFDPKMLRDGYSACYCLIMTPPRLDDLSYRPAMTASQSFVKTSRCLLGAHLAIRRMSQTGLPDDELCATAVSRLAIGRQNLYGYG